MTVLPYLNELKQKYTVHREFTEVFACQGRPYFRQNFAEQHIFDFRVRNIDIFCWPLYIFTVLILLQKTDGFFISGN